jgi:hypothetical protein
MKVNEVIADALKLVGRQDIAEVVDADHDDEAARQISTMLFCFNAVVDELARGYFPIKTQENFTSSNKKYAISGFTYMPIRIVNVYYGKKAIEWDIYPAYLQCDYNSITIEYEYVPAKSSMGETFTYPDYAVGQYLLTCGMAAEYLLICGELNGSSAWESKYRQEIDRILSCRPINGRVPPRRWL